MGDFAPGGYSRPSASQRAHRPKKRLTRCHTDEGIRPCKECCNPTANLGRLCTACLDVLTPLRLNAPPGVTNAADTA